MIDDYSIITHYALLDNDQCYQIFDLSCDFGK